MSNSSENSSILLVCVGRDVSCSDSQNASLAELYAAFSPYGPLRKIIIFSRKFVVKSFVEFCEVEDARRARIALNDCTVTGLGRTRTYFSALQQLTNSNKYLESWDCISGLIEVDSNCTEQNSCKEEKQTCASSSEDGEEKLDSSFVRQSNFLDRRTVPLLSSVVLISNVDSVFTSARELLNLFSCFGYVVKLLFMRNLRKALVEYALPVQAERAVIAINAQRFPTLRIKANFSRYKTIDLKKNNKSGNSQQFNEVMVLTGSQNRCAEGEVPLQGLNRSMLLRCDRIAGLQLLDLYLLAQDLILPSQVKPSSDETTLQLRLEFFNSEESLLAVAKLHGALLKGSPVSASFC